MALPSISSAPISACSGNATSAATAPATAAARVRPIHHVSKTSAASTSAAGDDAPPAAATIADSVIVPNNSATTPAKRALAVALTRTASNSGTLKMARPAQSVACMPISGGNRMAAGAATSNGATSSRPIIRPWRWRSEMSLTEPPTRRSQRAATASSRSPVLVPDRRTQRTRTRPLFGSPLLNLKVASSL